MTGYDFGDLVLVPFPFTDQTATKKRPAAVISSTAYHQHRTELLILAVSSQARPGQSFGEATIAKWQRAGLLKPSLLKPVIATIDRALVLRRLGQLEDEDKQSMRLLLGAILGA